MHHGPSINLGLKRPRCRFFPAEEIRHDGGVESNLLPTDGRFPLNLPDLSHASGCWQRAKEKRLESERGQKKRVRGDWVSSLSASLERTNQICHHKLFLPAGSKSGDLVWHISVLMAW